MFKYHGYSGPCPKPPHPAPVSPVDKGLDFEAARSSARIGPHGEEDLRIFEHILNAQHLAALEGVRTEERKSQRVASLLAWSQHTALVNAVREWQNSLNEDEKSLRHIIAKGQLASLLLPEAE